MVGLLRSRHLSRAPIIVSQRVHGHYAAADLPPWEDDSAFEQLLLSFESILPLRQLSEFRDARIHQRILRLSEGVLGRICKLMEAAAIEAIHSGEERISLSLFIPKPV